MLTSCWSLTQNAKKRLKFLQPYSINFPQRYPGKAQKANSKLKKRKTNTADSFLFDRFLYPVLTSSNFSFVITPFFGSCGPKITEHTKELCSFSIPGIMYILVTHGFPQTAILLKLRWPETQTLRFIQCCLYQSLAKIVSV